jgi:type II secretory pathway component PulM
VIETLRPRQRRVLALVLSALLITGLYLLVLEPVVRHFRDRADERQTALRSLSRDRALLEQAPQIQATQNSVANSPRWARFYDSQKATQATLQLETDLRAIVSPPNQIASMIAEPATTQGSLTRLAVKITLSLSIDQLTEILGRLNQHARFLKIESLTVQAPDYQIVDSNPVLSVQAEIVGFMLTPATTAT